MNDKFILREPVTAFQLNGNKNNVFTDWFKYYLEHPDSYGDPHFEFANTPDEILIVNGEGVLDREFIYFYKFGDPLTVCSDVIFLETFKEMKEDNTK
jgi:hypothetical protein